MGYKTEQEEFWNGQFGDEYVDRNQGAQLTAGKTAVWSRILSRTRDVKSVIEFGSNIGLNLKAIKYLMPQVKCSAVEINHKAAQMLRSDGMFRGDIEVFETSISEYDTTDKIHDLAFDYGVLIHINPDELENVYQKLYESSARYICMAEYYNPLPVTIGYRGNADRLFKRDFAGEFMDKYPDVRLVDYGFQYHRDNNFAQDDITWFLMEKVQ